MTPYRATVSGVGDGLAAQLEQCAVASWPPREALDLDGWSLRFTDGFTHRANSVATQRVVSNASHDLDARIEAAETEYRRRGLLPMFQITPATVPLDLPARLLARGYETRAKTNVCIAPAAALAALLPRQQMGDVCLLASPDVDFTALIVSGSKSEGDGHERLDVLSRVDLPHVCAVARTNGIAVAAGTGTVCNGWVGINMMRTAAAHRRQGHAQRVLAALARWAMTHGVAHAYLGVECDNAPARALYAKACFTTAYTYEFSCRPSTVS